MVHVSTIGSDTLGDGSQEHPFRTIQKGISTAWWDSDTILVERGTYKENLDFSRKNIMLASHYIFDGMESTIESTIIRRGSSSFPVVSFTRGEDSTAVLCGFTITDSRTKSAVYCVSSGPTIMHNVFVDNCTTYSAEQPVIKCYGSSARIIRNLIHNNGTTGIELVSWNNVQVTNNTISHNKGGIDVWLTQESIPVIKNNIVAYNDEYGIYTWGGENSYFGYNDVWWNDSNYANYSGMLRDQTGINGNISADPLFADTSLGDYHLTIYSPCIDVGDPLSPRDPDGSIADIGAYYYPQQWNKSLWHVATSGCDTCDGSPSCPLATIRRGIELAYVGDTVLIHPGNYVENVNFRGKKILLGSEFILDGDTSKISQSVIDGSNPNHPDTCSVVLFCSGEDSTSKLVGFTLRNGTGSHVASIGDPTAKCGGGVCCYLHSSPTISNNIIE